MALLDILSNLQQLQSSLILTFLSGPFIISSLHEISGLLGGGVVMSFCLLYLQNYSVALMKFGIESLL